jgi:hypothetical protein
LHLKSTNPYAKPHQAATACNRDRHDYAAAKNINLVTKCKKEMKVFPFFCSKYFIKQKNVVEEHEGAKLNEKIKKNHQHISHVYTKRMEHNTNPTTR